LFISLSACNQLLQAVSEIGNVSFSSANTRSPQVAVSVPVSNDERFLREGVDSLLRQTTDFELLIVNGGSADSTAAIFESYSGLRLQIFVNEHDIKVLSSHNLGLACALGECVGTQRHRRRGVSTSQLKDLFKRS
jgi:cellulose synthase/poly-beta-1,6-N-acetylglucosamine synthase-like glycosyltransferase